MKIAVAGKGGVGKSTIAATLALMLAKKGQKVLALDADPDANLASALGIPHSEQEKITTIAKQIDLIEERTGAKVGQYGQVFKLNPEVSDVAEGYAYGFKGVSLLVLGASSAGGGGCACPENTFIRALVTDLVLFKDETLIMDMEAGIEHLGRATSKGVDIMLVVVEPGQRSVDCALQVTKMADEIGLRNILYVANKVTGDADIDFLKSALAGKEIIAFLPYSETIREADRDGVGAYGATDDAMRSEYGKIIRRVSE